MRTHENAEMTDVTATVSAENFSKFMTIKGFIYPTQWALSISLYFLNLVIDVHFVYDSRPLQRLADTKILNSFQVLNNSATNRKKQVENERTRTLQRTK